MTLNSRFRRYSTLYKTRRNREPCISTIEPKAEMENQKLYNFRRPGTRQRISERTRDLVRRIQWAEVDPEVLSRGERLKAKDWGREGCLAVSGERPPAQTIITIITRALICRRAHTRKGCRGIRPRDSDTRQGDDDPRNCSVTILLLLS